MLQQTTHILLNNSNGKNNTGPRFFILSLRNLKCSENQKFVVVAVVVVRSNINSFGSKM